MAWRGRPSSTTPQQAVEELAGQQISGTGRTRDSPETPAPRFQGCRGAGRLAS